MHSPELGDYIGVESCVDLRSDVFENPSDGGQVEVSHRPRRRRRRRSKTTAKEYPPPIPWLASAENSNVVLVMRKYHTSDGRLVIKEEKAEQREYFHAHRSNGRLVLNLVPFDDVAEDKIGISDEVINGGDGGGGSDDPTVEEPYLGCYKYAAMGGVSPCDGFGVAVPLHT